MRIIGVMKNMLSTSKQLGHDHARIPAKTDDSERD